jgi:hypothetical protein
MRILKEQCLWPYRFTDLAHAVRKCRCARQAHCDDDAPE